MSPGMRVQSGCLVLVHLTHIGHLVGEDGGGTTLLVWQQGASQGISKLDTHNKRVKRYPIANGTRLQCATSFAAKNVITKRVASTTNPLDLIAKISEHVQKKDSPNDSKEKVSGPQN